MIRMRDALERRGPDGAGLWRLRNAVLAHRRLAVIDPSEDGAQPMCWPIEASEPRYVLVYNGELYNDSEVRRDLMRRGVKLRGNCDTETVLAALATWGPGVLTRMRGMFSFAFWDTRTSRLLVVRDPLGIKPVYYTVHNGEFVFASEIRSILEHPAISPRANMRMVSAYLTTIRTVLGEHTLFEDIKAVPPGHLLWADMSGSEPKVEVDEYWRGHPTSEHGEDFDASAESLRATIDQSIERHLRADVPSCCLLSGGIDSSIITSVARGHTDLLRTYAAGAVPDPGDDGAALGAGHDLEHARLVAQELGTDHSEAIVDGGMFGDRWAWMVDQLGTPLSTPNEVAIHAVAARLREDGCVVTLSGEGADEMLAGYEGPMDQAAAFIASDEGAMHPGRYQLWSSAWVGVDIKKAVLSERVRGTIEDDAFLVGFYEHEFEKAATESGTRGLAAHLRLQRRVNLTGLLQRLDTSTMLASVEGRTPFADIEVARACETLPMHMKYRAGAHQEPGSAHAGEMTAHRGGGCAVAGAQAVRTDARTKMILRRSYAEIVPDCALNRPKASFPVPFLRWMDSNAGVIRSSQFAQSAFSADAIEAVAGDPGKHWNLAWPMINLSLWAKKWWG